MKRLALLVGSLFVIVMTCVVLVRAQANQAEPAPVVTPQRTITAIGSATVTGKPDSARVFFGVTTNGKTVAAAREENARVVGQVYRALLALKLLDLKTRTTDSRVSISYAENDRSRVVGYAVRQSFTVLVKESDSEKLGKTAERVLDAGLQNGVNSDGYIEFFKADDSELRRLAMSKAVEDALANAQAYAVGAKVKTLGVVDIAGQDGYFEQTGFGGQFGGGFGGTGGAPSIVAGDWKVPSRVRVVCRY
jgi:uncharacterized protein YggE